MFTAQWKTNYRQQVSTSEGTAFTVLIEGRRFLFFGQTLKRITGVRLELLNSMSTRRLIVVLCLGSCFLDFHSTLRQHITTNLRENFLVGLIQGKAYTCHSITAMIFP